MMKSKIDIAKDLMDSLIKDLKITARCRFNAARRLKFNQNVSYTTNIVASLGLILIPLLQVAGLQHNFSSNSLSSIQIFLAVSVLVYSIHINSSNYEMRIKELEDCGNDIQNLMRELKSENMNNIEEICFQKYREKYTEILKKVENHEDADFNQTKIQMANDFKILECDLIKLKITSYFLKIKTLFIPSLFIIFEIIIVLDMIDVTDFLTPLH